MLNTATNQLIQAKLKETITMSLSHYQLLIFLLVPDLILLESDRPCDKTEKMATENWCDIKWDLNLLATGHVRQVAA